MVRVPNEELLNALLRVLLKLGFTEERGRRCAQLFVETTCDGIYSHGLNRFPRFVRTIQNGLVDVHAQPRFVQSYGSLERWDGRSGPGNLNAWESMDRAIALYPRIEAFLQQGFREQAMFEPSLAKLDELFA